MVSVPVDEIPYVVPTVIIVVVVPALAELSFTTVVECVTAPVTAMVFVLVPPVAAPPLKVPDVNVNALTENWLIPVPAELDPILTVPTLSENVAEEAVKTLVLLVAPLEPTVSVPPVIEAVAPPTVIVSAALVVTPADVLPTVTVPALCA